MFFTNVENAVINGEKPITIIKMWYIMLAGGRGPSVNFFVMILSFLSSNPCSIRLLFWVICTINDCYRSANGV